jgi:TPR repeat protein
MYAIAVLMESGEGGLAKNKNEAVKYYILSAEHGYVQGMLAASTIYSEGLLVNQDRKRGLAWLMLAGKYARHRQFSLRRSVQGQFAQVAKGMKKSDLPEVNTIKEELIKLVDANKEKYKAQQQIN